MTEHSVYEEIGLGVERTTPSSRTQLPTIVLNGAIWAAIFTVGTGGVANPQAVKVPTFTGPVTRVCSLHVGQSDEDRILDTQERIAGIRRYLSLNMTDLARVLRVGRPTVYSWATTPVSLKSRHRDRINELYDLGRHWRSLSSRPMGMLVREPLRDGTTVVDLLSAENLNTASILDGMQQMARRQGAVERRFTVAEAAARAGLKLPSRPRKNWRSNGDLEA